MELEQLAAAVKGYQEGSLAAITALESKVIGLTDDLEAVQKKIGRASFAGAGANGDYATAEERKAFNDYLRTGAESLEMKAAMVGGDPEGGYSVIAPLASTMTKRIYELSPIRQLARAVRIQSDAFEELVDKDEAGATWAGETTAPSETAAPKLAALRIPAHDIIAEPKATQRLLEDSSIDIGTWLVDKVIDKFSRTEAAAFINGDGVLKPRGFLTYPVAATADATRPWGTIEYVPSGASGAFAGTDPGDALVTLVYALKADYRARAVWLMSRDMARRVRQFKDEQGQYLWAQGLEAGQPDRLLGFPVHYAEDMPALGANSLSIAFGDFMAGYTIVDRLGVTVLRDPFTAKPYVKFYTRKRVGGAVNNFEAIKVMKFASS